MCRLVPEKKTFEFFTIYGCDSYFGHVTILYIKFLYPKKSIKAVLLLWIICVFHAFTSVHCCLVVTCWERADLLALHCDVLL